MTTNDTITVSEGLSIFLPGLAQTNLGIIAGRTYRLAFDTTITSGVLRVYQGSQLIYSSGGVYLSELVTLSESISITVFYPASVLEAITITETVSLSIV